MSLVSALAVSLLSFSIGAYASIGPVADLHIVNGDIAPDGFSRPAVLAGGTFPGPLITGRKGDNFQINVIDELTDESMLKSTSVHWHGLFQRGSAWADGPAFVTQCPITSGNSFLYDFDVKDQAGTYWYHSHLSTQYCDGLRGPLVVYDPKDPHALLYDVDDESTIITLADWYHTQAKKLKGPAIADATLINGLGRSATGTDSELTVITVQYDKRYRFRLVAMSCDPNYVFSIDQHLMTIIEADGVNSQPLPVDSIQIFAGQRYSFVLHAIQPIGSYWIRANPNTGYKGFDNGINSAILRYSGAPQGEPTTPNLPSTAPLKETDLSPLKSTRVPGKPYPGGADVNKNLLLSFTPEFRFAINNASFIPPTAPVLLQILSGAHTPQDLLPPGSVIPLPPNKVIEISLPITSSLVGFPHPFHLHGHNFHVVRSAGSTEYNFLNPIIRDVVNTGVPGDNVTIRFETDNAGPWFLHCHIDFHLEIGLAIVFAEDVENDSLRSVPESWSELCPKYDALASNDQ